MEMTFVKLLLSILLNDVLSPQGHYTQLLNVIYNVVIFLSTEVPQKKNYWTSVA